MPPQNSPQNFPPQSTFPPTPSSPLNNTNVPPSVPPEPTPPSMGNTIPPTPPPVSPEPVIRPEPPHSNARMIWAVVIILVLVLAGAAWLIGPQGIMQMLGGGSSVAPNSLVPDQMDIATTSDMSDSSMVSASSTATSTLSGSVPVNPPSFKASIVGDIAGSSTKVMYYALQFYENMAKVSPVIAVATSSVMKDGAGNLTVILSDTDGIHNDIIVPVSATNTDTTATVKSADTLFAGDVCYSYDADVSGYVAAPCDYSTSITIGSNGLKVVPHPSQ